MCLFKSMANEETNTKTVKSSNPAKTDKAIKFFVLILSIFIVILEILKFFIVLLNPTIYFKNYTGQKESEKQITEETKLVQHNNETSPAEVISQNEISDCIPKVSKISKSNPATCGNNVNDKDCKKEPIYACVSATKSIKSEHLERSTTPTKTSNLSIQADNIHGKYLNKKPVSVTCQSRLTEKSLKSLGSVPIDNDNATNLNTPARRSNNLLRKCSVTSRSPRSLSSTPANGVKGAKLNTPAGRSNSLTRKSFLTQKSPKPLNSTTANGVKDANLNTSAGRLNTLSRKSSITEKSSKPLGSKPVNSVKGIQLNTSAGRLNNLPGKSSVNEKSPKPLSSTSTNVVKGPSLNTPAGRLNNLSRKSSVTEKSPKPMSSILASVVKGTKLNRAATFLLTP